MGRTPASCTGPEVDHASLREARSPIAHALAGPSGSCVDLEGAEFDVEVEVVQAFRIRPTPRPRPRSDPPGTRQRRARRAGGGGHARAARGRQVPGGLVGDPQDHRRPLMDRRVDQAASRGDAHRHGASPGPWASSTLRSRAAAALVELLTGRMVTSNSGEQGRDQLVAFNRPAAGGDGLVTWRFVRPDGTHQAGRRGSLMPAGAWRSPRTPSGSPGGDPLAQR